jgi:Mn2+/Fe2+ NRAMP family transporter
MIMVNPKHLALFAAAFLAIGATAVVSDTASAQLLLQQQQKQKPQLQQHAQVIRRTATRLSSPEPATTIPAMPAATPSPAIDKTSALGQALAIRIALYKKPSRFPD